VKLFKPKNQERDLANMGVVVQGNTQFALDLFRNIRSTQGNLFFSPFSISTALAMTYGGARGDTQEQMIQALHFLPNQEQFHPAFALLADTLKEIEEKGFVNLKAANSLWPQKGKKFEKQYLRLLKKTYGLRITSLDYGDEEAARQTINAWVDETTEGKIKDLIPAGILNNLTRLVLANAIYFKGDWEAQFDPTLTSEAPFFVTPDEQVMAPMMSQTHDFRYGEVDNLQILELPYAGNDLSMILLLPAERDGLAKLEESMTVENLQQWLGNLEETEVEVSLPKFEISFPFRLDDALKSLGMVDAFSPKADFSGMDGTTELFIGAALHKAFVSVDEQGTEAAAATAMIMQLKALPFPSVIVRADHPFVFIIRENRTGCLLFMGRVASPIQMN